MAPNPYVGVGFHWLGGLAAGSFYIPFRQVKKWSWETYWLVGGVFSWIVAPFVMASILVPDLWNVLVHSPPQSVLWVYTLGVLWGFGGLTFGLSMRYLGIALGYATVLGVCAVVGTLEPPLEHHEIGSLMATRSGLVTLFGVAVAVLGIAFSGMAGVSKEHELTDEQKKNAITEFHFVKGLLIAIVSGLFSAAMAIGLDYGKPINDLAEQALKNHGRLEIWSGLPALIVILLGGFTTNFLWCVGLSIKNRSSGEYVSSVTAPLGRNYFFAAVAGVTWYFQFFFYTMGSHLMGKYGFSSWTLHMASIIIFSTLWGIALKEWKGTSKRTHRLIALGLGVLIASTIIVGVGTKMKAAGW